MNGRPSRVDVLMDVAQLFAKRSTCDRLHVGAVLASDWRIIATGYNGAPASVSHCPPGPHEGPCPNSIHAEQNCIAFAARNGISTGGSVLITTHMPCLNCALLIVNAGVIAVTYKEPFRDLSGVDLLRSAGVDCMPYFERLD